MFAYTTTLRTPSMMAGVHQHEPISLEVDARFVRSSIIAATFRVNDRPNAKPNPDASSRDGSCNGFSSSPLSTNVNA